MGARSFLVHGLIAGLVAGLAAFALAYAVGEPTIRTAIAIEEAGAAPAETVPHEHPAGTAPHGHEHGHGEEAEVSRGVQETIGLVTGTVAIGLVLGGLTGLLAALAMGRLGGLGPVASTAVIGAVGFVAFTLVPFLKYPPNPPAVGDGATIGDRTGLYFGFVAISVLAAVAAVLMARRMLPSGGFWAVTSGVLLYVGLVAVAGVVLPRVDEVGAFPASTLWDFRVASLLTLSVLWGVLVLVLAGLVDRGWRRLQADQRRRELAAAL